MSQTVAYLIVIVSERMCCICQWKSGNLSVLGPDFVLQRIICNCDKWAL